MSSLLTLNARSTTVRVQGRTLGIGGAKTDCGFQRGVCAFKFSFSLAALPNLGQNNRKLRQRSREPLPQSETLRGN